MHEVIVRMSRRLLALPRASVSRVGDPLTHLFTAHEARELRIRDG